MNPRSTALLALVVAALGAFVWLYEIRGAERRGEVAEAEKRVFRDVEADAISQITLATKDGPEARLERLEGAWKLTAPLAFPADAASADGLASALADLPADASLDDASVPLSEYGLDGPPKIRFSVGERELALRVGARSPVGSGTYVATADDRPVRVVASYRLAALDKSLADLRDKRPLRFDREAAAELRVRWKDGGVRLVRDEQDPEAWRLVEPLAARADPRTVSKLLSDLEFLRSSGFDDQPPKSVLESLERPELAIEIVTRADGKQATARFALGAPGEGGVRPARGSASESVYQMPAGSLEDFPRSVDAFRDKQLTRFERSEAQRFELAFHAEGEGATQLVVGRREGDAWRTEPDAMKPEAAEALVRELSGLEGVKIAAESLGEQERAALGLSPPRVVARVLGGPEEGAEAVLAEVHLGVLDAKRGIAAKRPDRDTIFWLPAERAEQIPTSAEAFRERFLAPPPEPAPDPAAGAEPPLEPAPAAAPDAGPE
jgi:hypothetical protein